MSKSKKNGTSFLVQGSILAVASIISRIIGLIYRIPMTEIIGDIGNDYYGSAFEIYNVMLIISSYSLPLAVSKLVSAQVAKGRKKAAYQIFKGGLLFAIVSGTTVALIVFFGAEFFTANVIKTPFSIFALRVLAPTLLVVAILGVIRGFFQGLGTMMPSAISQIIEQIVNAIVSIWAAYVLFNYGTKVGKVLGDPDNYAAAYGAAGGTLGTGLGALAALGFVVFIFFVYMTVFKRQMLREKNVKVDSFGYTMKILVLTIIPVLLSTTIYNINGIIDNGIFKHIAMLQGYSKKEISTWWGVYAGKYKLLVNVPISIAAALAASSVPSLTAAYAEGNMDQVRRQINAAMRFTMVISFPCTVGLAVLANPIFKMIFPGTAETAGIASQMMWIGAITVVFSAMSTLSNGLLQGINKLLVPVINALISLVAHTILVVVLLLFFRINIYAMVIGDAFFNFMMSALNAYALKRHSKYKQEVVKTFIVPIICSTIMGVVTFVVYHGLYALIKSNVVAVVISMILAVLTYGICMLLLKGLNEEEIRKFPKGDLIVRIAQKAKLL
ncbi:MAG: polysaccharide biosynthesis protein [Agathobacter sp.]|nr:polysaccharide biosynthesis protein [Agathobacter sp.]